MKKLSRLELTWIGKDVRPNLEPRILLEDPSKSYHATHRVTDADIFDNKLIHGDNLLALKALEQEFTGKVKCIYIDPPYNTGSAFEHYDDGVEHSLWLSLMRDRLEILRGLLAEDGSLWVSLDDNEVHYFKVMADEVFGRKNFVANVIWHKKYSIANDHKTIAPTHDHILVYSKTNNMTRNTLPRTEKNDSSYKYSDERGVFRPDNYTCNKSSDERPNLYYPIIHPLTGKEVWPKKTAVWRYSREEHLRHVENGFIFWGVTGSANVPSFKRYLHLLKNQGTVPQTMWSYEDVNHTDGARKEVRAVLGSVSLQDDFLTPKPERLIQRVLHIATNPGDLVLDSFLGSGTTAAVAHKMGRRWIGIELGEHCITHCIPRLQKVVNAEDQGGITKTVNWQGGGGFRFYELAQSLIKLDPWDIPVINPAFNAEMLAEAVCKMHGYHYAPSSDWFWMHGQGHKDSHIFVTTQILTTEILQYISDQVGTRSLLICCPPCPEVQSDLFPNLTLSVMPNALLKRYEWDHDDYSLNVNNLPQATKPAPTQKPATAAQIRKANQHTGQASLLDLAKGGA